MKDYYNDLVDRLSILYKMYESYIWNYDNSNLNVLIQDDTISFYLYNDNDLVDEIIFSFSDKENSLYKYISVRILIILFGNVFIRREENVIYNNTHKPYVKLIVNDSKILDLMQEVIDIQEEEAINSEIEIVKGLRRGLPGKVFYPTKFMQHLDERIGISKKLLRTGGRR